jgi:hypothetical protein
VVDVEVVGAPVTQARQQLVHSFCPFPGGLMVTFTRAHFDSESDDTMTPYRQTLADN